MMGKQKLYHPKITGEVAKSGDEIGKSAAFLNNQLKTLFAIFQILKLLQLCSGPWIVFHWISMYSSRYRYLLCLASWKFDDYYYSCGFSPISPWCKYAPTFYPVFSEISFFFPSVSAFLIEGFCLFGPSDCPMRKRFMQRSWLRMQWICNLIQGLGNNKSIP